MKWSNIKELLVSLRYKGGKLYIEESGECIIYKNTRWDRFKLLLQELFS